jgi:hypothetical protein
MLQHKIRIFIHVLLKKPFWHKYVSLKVNLVTLSTLDTNVSRYRLKNESSWILLL